MNTFDESVETVKDRSAINGVSTSELFQTCEEFRRVMSAWDGEELQTRCLASLALNVSPETRAEIAFQFLTVNADPDSLSFADKKFAVDMAELIGPDWAQWFYHFAVLVTKVA